LSRRRAREGERNHALGSEPACGNCAATFSTNALISTVVFAVLSAA
jgi:hypothetical protein